MLIDRGISVVERYFLVHYNVPVRNKDHTEWIYITVAGQRGGEH
jgi:hypothetical protein